MRELLPEEGMEALYTHPVGLHLLVGQLDEMAQVVMRQQEPLPVCQWHLHACDDMCWELALTSMLGVLVADRAE